MAETSAPLSDLHLSLIVSPHDAAISELEELDLSPYTPYAQQITLWCPDDSAAERQHAKAQVKSYRWKHSLAQVQQEILERQAHAGLSVILDWGMILEAEDWQRIQECRAPGGYRVSLYFVDRVEQQARIFVGEEAHQSTVEGDLLPQLSGAQGFPGGLNVQAENCAALESARQEILKEQAEASDALEADSPPDIQWFLGWQHFQARRDAEAQSYFELLSQRTEPDFWQSFGRVMLLKTRWEMGQHDQVFQSLESFHQENPEIENIPGLWILRGVMARKVGEKELASECFQQALNAPKEERMAEYNLVFLRPELEWKAQLGLADLVFEDGVYPLAYKYYAEVAEQLPDNDYVSTQVLKSAFFTHRYQEMSQLMEKPERLRGISEAGLACLQAYLKVAKGQPLDAENEAQLMAMIPQLPRDPFFASVALELAIRSLHAQKLELAQKILLQLSQIMSNQVVIWHNLAYSFFAQQNYAEAERYYRKSLEISPQHHDSRMDLGKALYMQDRRDEARAEFEKILEFKADYHPAQRALQQLDDQEIAGMVLPGAPTSSSASPDPAVGAINSDLPFVFVFPVGAHWRNGADIALRAYLKEFIPEDNVLLALVKVEDQELLKEAESWAQNNFPSELLPPVRVMDEALPLPPGQSAWIFPWRQPPSPQLHEALNQSGCAVISTDMTAKYPPGQALPVKQVAESPEQGSAHWYEVDVEVIQNQMRLAWLGELNGPMQTNITSHAMLEFENSAERMTLPQSLTPLEQAPEATISVCMIVKDEAEQIERCLKSIHDQVDEIIVVDTGSQDNTRALAQGFEKVKLYDFEWSHDFAAARNEALSHATQDWILSLDADEYVADDFVAQLRPFLGLAQQPDLYAFPILAVDSAGEIDHSNSISMVPRLFPNREAYRYRGKVHEMVYHQERKKLDYMSLKQLPIYHVGYRPDIVQARDKFSRDRELMEDLIAQNPDAPETARIYSILAGLLFKNNEVEAAQKHYEQGLQSVQDDPLIRNVLLRGLAQCLKHQREHEALITRLQGCEDPKLMLSLSEAYAQVGDGAQAMDVALEALQQQDRQFLTADPLNLRADSAELFESVAQLAQKIGEAEQAFYFYKRAYKHSPSAQRKQRYQDLQAQVQA